MERDPIPGPGENRLLQLLSGADADRLRPHLERVALAKGQVCIERDVPTAHVYFLESGLSSSVFPDEVNGTSEIGMQGFEGLIGVPAVLGADQSPHRVFMQVEGSAQRIAVDALRAAMDESRSLRCLLLLYAQVFLVQAAQTAHVSARYGLSERLARWILMAGDRVGPRLGLTHEYLAYMLGTRRAGVTDGLHVLEGKHLIRSTRGLIVISDPDGLRDLAGQSYGVPEAEYRRLIGPLA